MHNSTSTTGITSTITTSRSPSTVITTIIILLTWLILITLSISTVIMFDNAHLTVKIIACALIMCTASVTCLPSFLVLTSIADGPRQVQDMSQPIQRAVLFSTLVYLAAVALLYILVSLRYYYLHQQRKRRKKQCDDTKNSRRGIKLYNNTIIQAGGEGEGEGEGEAGQEYNYSCYHSTR